ncbi:amino acid permease [Acinetobacter baumannii]
MQNREAGLHKKLSAKQMGMIAIGGAIGTGLFMGSKFAISFAGPAVIVSYAIGGLIAFALMACLAEMTVQHPTSGSFGAYAEHYISPLAGFLVRYCYWACIVLAVGTEITAVADYMKLWFPNVGSWVWIGFFSLTLLVVNAYSVKAFGLVEYWFSTIKVFAIIVFILLSIGILTQSNQGMTQVVTHLSGHGGFFPNGFSGLFYMLAFLMFAFGGIELIGMAAAEAKDPKKTIPKAINQVVFRILIFYIGSLAILLSLVPWNQLDLGGLDKSPFVMIFSQMGIGWAAHLLNFIILTAALSVYNSGMFANSRMLYGLAQQGNAPKIFKKVNKQGVPVPAVLLSALLIFGCVLLNYFVPEDALSHLMYIVVGALVLNWAMISMTHLKFKSAMKKLGQKTHFPALWAPFSNYLVLGFIAVVLYIMWSQGFKESVMMIPIWIVLMFILFKVLNAKEQ